VSQLKPASYSRAREAIIDYLISFSASRIHDDPDSKYPRTFGGSVGFVCCGLGGDRQPVIGDLIRLECAPQSKWRLSWLLEMRKLPNGDNDYLCKSIVDGGECWWSNVGVSFLHRPTLESHPSWRWTDDQFDFNDRWLKACKRHDPYLYRPVPPDFNEDGTATVGTRSRYDFDGMRPTAMVGSWRKVTIKTLEAVYLSLVEQHKAKEPRP